jgi:hypothetical protein
LLSGKCNLHRCGKGGGGAGGDGWGGIGGVKGVKGVGGVGGFLVGKVAGGITAAGLCTLNSFDP